MTSQKDIRALNQIPIDRARNRARKDSTMEPQKYRNPGDATPAIEVRTIHLADAVEEVRTLVDKLGYQHTAVCTLATSHPRDVGASRDIKPVCVVGHAYADWGIPLAHLDVWENVFGAERWENRDYVEHASGPVNFLDYGLQFTRAAAWFMRSVQAEQDYGKPWGTAFQQTLGRAHVLYGTALEEGHDCALYDHADRIPLGGWPSAPYNVKLAGQAR